MNDYKKEAKDILAKLKTQRDELNVRMHLAKAEVRDEWHEIEHKWTHFKQKTEEVLGEVDQTGHDVWDALKPAGAELKRGLDRIKEKL